jgi:hypothetical protein
MRLALIALVLSGCDPTLVTGTTPVAVNNLGPWTDSATSHLDAGAPTPTLDASSDAAATDAAGVTVVLHDMEDGSINFPSAAVGVLGSWFAAINYAAGRAPLPLDRLIEPVVPPRGTSQKACHLKAGQYEDGVDLFVDFHPISGKPDFNHADLRAYSGLAFWARSDANNLLVVAVADGLVDVQDEFWKAEFERNPWPSRQLMLTRTWQRYVLLFEDFRAGLPGQGRAVDPAAINSFHFLAGVGSMAVDFWIDDVALLCRGACP